MESEFIHWLERETPRRPALRVPIGDDAAVLDVPPNRQLVVAVDAIQDGVHFLSHEHDPRRIGRKALAINLSDLAAMAAEPLAAVVTLVLPSPADLRLAQELLRGIWMLAETFEMSVCGGDTNSWKHPLSISVTVFGTVEPQQAWTRSSGRVGDRLVVTGPLGGSLLGRHLDFNPLVREALAWRREYPVQAATDISDGLAIDAHSLAEASGCGAALDLHCVPVAEAAERLARTSGRAPLEHALEDGEDFELLLALPPAEANRFCETHPNAAVVGELVQQAGLWRRRAEQLEPMEVKGFRHA